MNRSMDRPALVFSRIFSLVWFMIPASMTTATAQSGFDQTLTLQGIRFHVTTANSSSLNRLRIQPSGLKGVNAVIEREVDGRVTGAEVADLNADGSPELYIYLTAVGSGSYGALLAYSTNHRKSLSEIYLPSLLDDPVASKGYMGHDEFRVVENVLVRRFPVYKGNDTNVRPTGGTRQIQYKLKAGEAGWVLRADRIVNY